MFTEVGTFSITVIVSDLYLSTAYTFYVFVQNSAPVFASTTSNSINVRVSQTATFTLPSYSDPEGNLITFTTYEQGYPSVPAFTTFSLASNSYSISPTLLSEVAAYMIDAKACDG